MPLPSVGDVVGDYKFLGGDPNKKESWEKVTAREEEESRVIQMPTLPGQRSGSFRRVTPAGEAEVRAARVVGAGGAAAAPALGMALGAAPAVLGGGTVGGLVANEAVDRGLRAAGVPEPVAEVAGNVAGAGGGLGGAAAGLIKGQVKGRVKKMILDFMEGFARRKAKKELGKKAVKETGEEMVEVAGKKFAPEVMTEMGQMMDKARFLKTGLSDAQTVDALKSLYGLTNKQAKDLLKLAVG